MAITTIEGKIGSGKTYYAVYKMLQLYFRYDEVLDRYIPKTEVVIVTNIRDFQPEHVDLIRLMDSEGLEYAFSDEYVLQLRAQRPAARIIYVVDEIQKIMPYYFKNEKVLGFFQTSRHLGLDVFIITQDVSTIARALQNLAEEVIHAVARSNRTSNIFRYKRKIDDDVVGSFMVRVDKRIFRFYKSQSFTEGEAPGFAHFRTVAIIGGGILSMFLLAKFVLMPMFSPDRGKKNPVAAVSKKGPVSKNESITYDELMKGVKYSERPVEVVPLSLPSSMPLASPPPVESFPPEYSVVRQGRLVSRIVDGDNIYEQFEYKGQVLRWENGGFSGVVKSRGGDVTSLREERSESATVAHTAPAIPYEKLIQGN